MLRNPTMINIPNEDALDGVLDILMEHNFFGKRGYRLAQEKMDETRNSIMAGTPEVFLPWRTGEIVFCVENGVYLYNRLLANSDLITEIQNSIKSAT